MHVRHPVWLRRASKPGAEAFAILFAIESLARALLTTVLPLEALARLGDAQPVSVLFFAVSGAGLLGSLVVPWLVRKSARRWVYSLGIVLLAGAPAVLSLGSTPGLAAGMALRALGVVTATVCLNLYIMDYIARRDFSHSEPLRVFYSAGAWTLGPFLGVALSREVGLWAAYGASAACALALLGYFWFLRLTDNPALGRPAGAPPSPLRNVRRFFGQPRLVLSWLISASRNGWWAMFYIYTPIYAVESGLGAYVGALLVSLSTGFLFLMPLWGWCGRRFGLRRLSMVGFGLAGAATVLVGVNAASPWLAAGLLILATLAMVSLDAIANIPFMLAVRRRERPEMTSVYATYRDVAELAPPGAFALLLKVFALPAVFIGGGLAMLVMAGLTARLHPRLGRARARAPGFASAGMAPSA